MASGITSYSPLSREFVSANQTITAGGTLTIPHGLGVVPKSVNIEFICTTAELGYSINDVVCVAEGAVSPDANQGISVVKNSTDIVLRYGSSGFALINKTTGAHGGITVGRWQLRLRVYA